MRTPPTRARRPFAWVRHWRVCRVGVLQETAFRSRLIVSPITLAIQLFITYSLWTAIYAHVRTSGGLGARQATTYALFALLIARVRWSTRVHSRDSLIVRVREGSVAYWFLRPVSPARYYQLKQIGDAVAGAVLPLGSCAILLALGILQPPGSMATGLAAAVTLGLGQVLLYYLGAVVDLTSFWFFVNTGVIDIYHFLEDLLAGVYVPLWLLPPLVQAAALWLPFSYAINLPVSLYVGRIVLDDAIPPLLGEAAWVLVLAVLTRLLWRAAGSRIAAVGG